MPLGLIGKACMTLNGDTGEDGCGTLGPGILRPKASVTSTNVRPASDVHEDKYVQMRVIRKMFSA